MNRGSILVVLKTEERCVMKWVNKDGTIHVEMLTGKDDGEERDFDPFDLEVVVQ